MIMSGNQPYFLPYIGYWQLINASDIFEICDDYQYINRGWVNRNKILINGRECYYNIEIQNDSDGLLGIEIDLKDLKKKIEN